MTDTEKHPPDFTQGIAACLAYGRSDALSSAQREQLEKLVGKVLSHNPEEGETTTREGLEGLQREIDRTLGQLEIPDQVALVYGGATKIKGYVFEAPRLPEIRGASALLDWVNGPALHRLWAVDLGKEFKENCIVYASGGNILAFAPASKGQELATEIEHIYTRETLTANSVAVSETFSLLELRYGRKPLAYWVEEFVRDWQDAVLQSLLASYYYADERVKESLTDRFYRRKTFGELVTVLAGKSNRRRESLESDGARRDIPHFPPLPWSQKCRSSDIRPAVVQASAAGNPFLSEASALKLYVGQHMKRPREKLDWFVEKVGWQPDIVKDIADAGEAAADEEHFRTWEERFLEACADTRYRQECEEIEKRGASVKAAQDIGEIGQASSPSGYIGIIYADGNNVGRRVARSPDPTQYWKLARDLTFASEKAVFSALAEHLHPKQVRTEKGEPQYVHPFEIITIGGDDLFIIVPGSAALNIALSIGYTFEELLGEKRNRDQSSVVPGRYQGIPDTQYGFATCTLDYDFATYTPDIGLSAGVVIAQENAPIFFLRDLVEELLKSAKKKSKKTSNGGGAIDFMVLKAITMVTDTVETFREQALATGAESSMHLTGRPYTWRELQGLLATVQALRKVNFPRSQLYRLRQRLFEAPHEGGIFASVLDYLYMRTSGLKRDSSELLGQVFDSAWHPMRQGIAPWIYLKREIRINDPINVPRGEKYTIEQRCYETIWPDLVEIYDFVTGNARMSSSEKPITSNQSAIEQ